MAVVLVSLFLVTTTISIPTLASLRLRLPLGMPRSPLRTTLGRGLMRCPLCATTSLVLMLTTLVMIYLVPIFMVLAFPD